MDSGRNYSMYTTIQSKNSPERRKLSLQSKTSICAVAMPAELVVAAAIR